MAGKMPPPGGDGHGVAIMIGVPKGGDSGKMPPPGSGEPQREGKASPEEAGVRRDDERCIDCSNYDPSTGECSKVEGTLAPGDTCGRYFQPVDEEDGESEDQESGEDESREALGTGPRGLPEGGQ